MEAQAAGSWDTGEASSACSGSWSCSGRRTSSWSGSRCLDASTAVVVVRLCTCRDQRENAAVKGSGAWYTGSLRLPPLRVTLRRQVQVCVHSGGTSFQGAWLVVPLRSSQPDFGTGWRLLAERSHHAANVSVSYEAQ